jgi:hypothetical protein
MPAHAARYTLSDVEALEAALANLQAAEGKKRGCTDGRTIKNEGDASQRVVRRPQRIYIITQKEY